MSKKIIVITSISSPTKAVLEFSKLEGYELIVVGDKKTPKDWKFENCNFISVDKQNQKDFGIAKRLPFNHYSRKMIGYLAAIKLGADIIVDTDDDNIPKNNWGFPEFDNFYDVMNENLGFINIYNLFTKQKIWPRGFPLDKINNGSLKFENNKIKNRKVSVGVWQGLVDGDPDVDAIYRLTNNNPCFFKERNPIVLDKGTLCPFNSQNTVFRRELFALLYLPAFVTFRFTDILRSLVAQVIMWLYGYRIGFLTSTAIQERNAHSLLKDFESEIPIYLHSEVVIGIIEKNIKSNLSIKDNLFTAYEALHEKSLVKKEELQLLEEWLRNIND